MDPPSTPTTFRPLIDEKKQTRWSTSKHETLLKYTTQCLKTSKVLTAVTMELQSSIQNMTFTVPEVHAQNPDVQVVHSCSITSPNDPICSNVQFPYPLTF